MHCAGDNGGATENVCGEVDSAVNGPDKAIVFATLDIEH